MRRLDSPPKTGESITTALLGSSITLLHQLESQAELTFTLPTPAGESAPIYLLRHEQTPFWYIPFHGIDFMTSSNNVEVAFTRTWSALHQLGVRDVLSGAATGCIHPDMKPGDLVIIDDFIDFATSRPRSILTELWEQLPYTFAAFVPPLCPELTQILDNCVQAYRFGDVFSTATFGQFEGHRYESPAEIQMAQRAGADVVAHHNASEAIYARELGIHYAAILYVTNYAAGLSTDWVAAADYEETSRQGKQQCADFLLDAVVRSAQRSPECVVCPGPDSQPLYVSGPAAASTLKPIYR